MYSFKRLSGILVNPTSFPSPYGIGDLGKGAYAFIDFLYSANQRLWQVLPLGPTSFGDSPYQSFSTFAGNPQLISPELLVAEGYLTTDHIQPTPNFDPYVIDYGSVIKYKNQLFHYAYKRFLSAATKMQVQSFENFCKRNSFWLDDYALFMALKEFFYNQRANNLGNNEYKMYKAANIKILTEEAIDDLFYGAAWSSWPKDIKNRTQVSLDTYKTLLEKEINYHKFLQFEFYKQWFELKKYANAHDIKIIGDIPIFVAMDSADVWAQRELFKFDETGYPTDIAGVPPDYFSNSGQLWGNPVYNWNVHEQTGFVWWIERIKSTLTVADILRIDHFRGFEANWCVPFGAENAVKGEWREGPGMSLFTAAKDVLGQLPIIAEDLGIITDKVEKLRDDAGLPGMKVLQFAFGGSADNPYLPHNYLNANTIVYTGTHDNDTSFGWYSNASEHVRDHFRRYANVSGNEPSWDMIRLAMSSVAVFAIFPIQDVLSLDSKYRTNTPGVKSGNWQFRYTQDMLNPTLVQQLTYLNTLFNRNY